MRGRGERCVELGRKLAALGAADCKRAAVGAADEAASAADAHHVQPSLRGASADSGTIRATRATDVRIASIDSRVAMAAITPFSAGVTAIAASSALVAI